MPDAPGDEMRERNMPKNDHDEGLLTSTTRGRAATDTPAETRETAESLAQRFHETYERLAPSFGYATREASAKPWADVPEQNKRLMIAVCAEILAALSYQDDGRTLKVFVDDARAAPGTTL